MYALQIQSKYIVHRANKPNGLQSHGTTTNNGMCVIVMVK